MSNVSKTPGAKKKHIKAGQLWRRHASKRSSTAKSKPDHHSAKAKVVSNEKLHVKDSVSKSKKNHGNSCGDCLRRFKRGNHVGAFNAEGKTDHRTESKKAVSDVPYQNNAAAAQVETTDDEIVEESHDTPVDLAADDGKCGAKELKDPVVDSASKFKVEVFTAEGRTDHRTASRKAVSDVPDGHNAHAAQVNTTNCEIVVESHDNPNGRTADNGNDAPIGLTEGEMFKDPPTDDPASKLMETQKKNDQEQQVLQPEMAIVVRGGRHVSVFNFPTGRACEIISITRLEDSLNANDNLFCLFDWLEWSLVADRIDDAVRVVNTIKYSGQLLKRTIEGVKTQIERCPKLRKEELQRLEDKHKELKKKEGEASQQLDDCEIALMVSGDAVAHFSRDENQAKLNLEHARLMHKEAADALKKSWFPGAEVRWNLDHAKERLAKAEAHMEATRDAKKQQKKAQADAAERYADAKKAHKECKTEMRTIGQMLKVLKIAAAFTARACTELEIILHLSESDCSRQELKQAVKREFSKEGNGADEETTATLALIPAPEITEYRFWATKERWQYVKEAILANREYFE